jgi:integrase
MRGQEVKYIKLDDLKRIREYFKLKNKIVMLGLLNIGCNVGMRVSDLTKLKFEDIGKDGIIRLKEQKTGKSREILLNKPCMKAVTDLKKYYRDLGFDQEGYLFKSTNRAYVKNKEDMAITTLGINKNLKAVQEMLGLTYPIGTHSFRKTWGYVAYKKTLNIALIMRAFNHSSAEQTLKYIGVEQENINKLYENIEV